HWGQKADGLDVEKFTGFPPDYRISKVNDMMGYTGWGGHGPKPSGMISVGGVLYLAFQNLLGMKAPAYGTKSQHGSDATIVYSRDYGKTWTPDIKEIRNPMFPGHLFGGPAFINFGKDNAGARDRFVYAVSADQWDNGSHLRLGRVPQGKVMDATSWEWVAERRGMDGPRWTKDLGEATPILSDDRHISAPDLVYLTSLHRYLLLTWYLHEDFSNAHGSGLVIYDAPEPWGPFTLAYHGELWETIDVNPYCPRLPLKWMEADGVTGWLQFSGNWRRNSPHYRSHVRKFRVLRHK
ncbi:MAG: DUF4185 domain-containing protein, partial [Anaerolineae bacterium]|nr:DUF4185 domain-containing protein [Anaerolineae bacterium]